MHKFNNCLMIEKEEKFMKKYALIIAIGSLFCMPQLGAMEKGKKREVRTSLSSKQVTELRRAVEDYKKNKSRQNQERIINKYGKEYPDDSFVRAKLSEKARSDSSMQPQIVKKEPKGQLVKKEAKTQE